MAKPAANGSTLKLQRLSLSGLKSRLRNTAKSETAAVRLHVSGSAKLMSPLLLSRTVDKPDKGRCH
jgi:hypothetical protein